MAQIILLGTSHISRQSISDITSAVEKYKPEVIAVELDAARLHALFSNKRSRPSIRDIRRVGFKGFLFALIGSYVQKKLGKFVGTPPGSDMLHAVKLARQKGLNLALIDQSIETTLRNFSRSLTWKEKLNFIIDIFKGLFFPSRELKRYGIEKIDLRKVPPEKLIRKMSLQLKKRYPSIYSVLITERNNVMIKNLRKLASRFQDSTILAVVGAGHRVALFNAFKQSSGKSFRKS